ncbi:hypothetical protein H310_02580 [Aphanomyces invadans]|uniref:Uncharacterized protein n=1 Tax=Aphanomyces invadans TaxID=157072 RepID=A0A024UKA3_9STRA|nr:hypothetical protein H310_02580 [Aphanomyces invadans]ETW06287.1 hypothetical protein H310_02580 [Aphanomyces invadans]|eukprot:XP_008864362.1 hypothetical protein H310_02580 [Aphanomyces invadans]
MEHDRGAVAVVDSPLSLQKCELLSGLQTYAVQMLLFVIALTSLWYKRHVERPKRSVEIWMMDVSKQGLGAVVGHFTNILIAISLPHVTDQCVWYFLNFFIDFTLGTVISLSLLRLQQEAALWANFPVLFESGDYGSPPSYRIWGIQLAAWLSIIIFSKGIVTSVLIATAHPLSAIGNALFRPLAGHPFAELVLVMIVIPSFLNVVQFWIQDSFLKRDAGGIFAYYARGKTSSGSISAKHSSINMDASLHVGLLD